MNIVLICMGHKMPVWINQGVEEYIRRLPSGFLRVVEIPLKKRSAKSDLARLRDEEGEKMLAALPVANARVLALDERGRQWNTRGLAEELDHWRRDGRDVALLVGGPEGLAPACLERAEAKWSLSALTLPHALARLIVVEQLYRAWSVLQGHPYHRD